MNISEEQKYKFYNLMQKDAQIKAYKREYIKKRREKERENGIKQPSVISKINTQNVCLNKNDVLYMFKKIYTFFKNI